MSRRKGQHRYRRDTASFAASCYQAAYPPTGRDLYAEGFREVKGWNVKPLWPYRTWLYAVAEKRAREVSGRNMEVWS